MTNAESAQDFYTKVYQKPQSSEVRYVRYGVRQKEFLFILGNSLPFYSTTDPKNKNLEKM